ncbi:hypothetical protein GA0115240_100411 [Streptomyces sp. DvalAA-14]|uniref:hypothetical protein n=1 Tax=unclassified Streptomyces TaxID=2593676 RepID=UPI00081B1BE6|nr:MULTISPECIES: hypothetical protein [unclassified Streptomyces]MYS18703.1 hypothetical protein [Streptomyces sp. SID4948]SCD27865.1 hypothetical protein GA0115240_100411 [Streptomyces sp. DvalAA-14]
MSRTPGADLPEEPQEERGPKGSRDTGSERPSAGSGASTGRPAAGADERSDSSVEPSRPIDPDAPRLQSGGG